MVKQLEKSDRPTSRINKKLVNKMQNKTLFDLANEADFARDYKKSFKLMHQAAKKREVYAYNSLGYYYDNGIGTRKNKKKALHWYKKAARQRDIIAYSNVGLSYRDMHNTRNEKLWLQRAVAAGVDDAALELAKLYLRNKRKDNLLKAKKYLEIVIQSKNVFDASREEATLLLKQFKKKLNQMS